MIMLQSVIKNCENALYVDKIQTLAITSTVFALTSTYYSKHFIECGIFHNPEAR